MTTALASCVSHDRARILRVAAREGERRHPSAGRSRRPLDAAIRPPADGTGVRGRRGVLRRGSRGREDRSAHRGGHYTAPPFDDLSPRVRPAFGDHRPCVRGAGPDRRAGQLQRDGAALATPRQPVPGTGRRAARGQRPEVARPPPRRKVLRRAPGVHGGAVPVLWWLGADHGAGSSGAEDRGRQPAHGHGRRMGDSRWGPWLDEQHPNPALPGELRWFVRIDGKDTEVEGPEPFEWQGETLYPQSRTFIPAKLPIMSSSHATRPTGPRSRRCRSRSDRNCSTATTASASRMMSGPLC